MSIFKTYGVNNEYPKFTVITPQTGFTYDVRTLTVQEVHAMKETLTTSVRAISAINEILWKSIVSKPEGIETYEDFKANTTLKDRLALTYGVYNTTFGSEKEYDVGCSFCKTRQKLKINLNNIVSIESYPRSSSVKASYRIAKATDPNTESDIEIENALTQDEIPPEGMPESQARLEFPKFFEKIDKEKELSLKMQPKRGRRPKSSSKPKTIEQLEVEDKISESNVEEILSREIKVILPVSKITVVVHQPTIEDEELIISKTPYIGDKQIAIINDTLAIKRFEEYENGNPNPINVVTDRVEIVEGYQILPAGDRKIIFNAYAREFGRYRIRLESEWTCINCQGKNELFIDPVNMFFRMVDEF